MKKNYFSLFLALSSVFLFAQNNDFNNGGGDLLWSNPANWTLNAVPVPENTVRLPLIVESQVDALYTITKIQTIFPTSGDVSVAGASTLTLNPGTANGFGIQNASNNNIKLMFKGLVEINNPAGFTYIENGNGATNSIEFSDGSTLTLTTNLSTDQGSNNAGFYFNGMLSGNGNLRFGLNTTATFGSTASNSGYTGQLVFLGNSSVIVNTADDNVFFSGQKLQVNGNSSITIDGANVFASNIVVGASNAFTFNANKDQNSMGLIVFSGGSADGTLNLVIDNSVTNLSFADNSATDWASGTVNITGFTEGVIRFGTDSNGLTSTQLSQINVVGGTGPVALNSSGYLVYQSSLSTDDFDQIADKRISYPSLATNKLTFNKPQENVKVFDISGKMIFKGESQNQTELNINTIKPGLYLIVFDNKKVEKFIKQ